MSQSTSKEIAAMSDFLTFRRMITPVIIEVLFIIGAFLTFVTGIGLIALGLDGNKGGEVALGVAVAVLGPLGIRLYAEILIVVFRINETLTDIHALVGWSVDRSYAEDEAAEGEAAAPS